MTKELSEDDLRAYDALSGEAKAMFVAALIKDEWVIGEHDQVCDFIDADLDEIAEFLQPFLDFSYSP